MAAGAKAIRAVALAASILAFVTGLNALAPQAALAASFTVNSTNDAVDAAPGDGVCQTATSGECTLRAAIQEANASPGPHTINLPAGTYLLTIAGASDDLAASGDLDVNGSITIAGAGGESTIVDARGLDRVFQVGPSAVVILSGITIRGGASGVGAGVYNEGTLNISGSVVSNNTQYEVGGGGGIENAGALSVDDSTIRDNSAWQAGAGIENESGATATILNSFVSGNINTLGGSSGAGIANWGILTLSGSTVAANGGVFIGGGVLNDGSMTLTNTVVNGNTAVGGAGGILNQGSMVLNGSTISGNLSIGSGAGISNSGTLSINFSNITGNTQQGVGTETNGGGGIFVPGGDVTLSGSVVTSNTAWRGGGIWTEVGTDVAGSLTVSDSVIDGNTALDLGGGIFFLGGTATFTGTTVSNNSAVDGGGVFGSRAQVTMTNSTVSGNSAASDGGGISHCYCQLRNVTVTNNTADFDADGTGNGGGLALGDPAVQNDCCAELRNTIIAGNIDYGGEMPDVACLGESLLIWQGHNLVQDFNPPAPPVASGCNEQGDTSGNIIGQPALLGPLADNGGTTMTHALLPGSLAIDSGNPAAPGSGGNACESTDQRGVLRPQGLRCDIGAYEKQPSVGGVAEQPDVIALPSAEAPPGRSAKTYVGAAAITLIATAATVVARRKRRF